MQQSRSYGGSYGPSWAQVDQSAVIASVAANTTVNLPIDEFAFRHPNVSWAHFTTTNGVLLLDSGFYTLTTQLNFTFPAGACELLLNVQSWQGWIDVSDVIIPGAEAGGKSISTVAGFIDINDPLSFFVHVATPFSITNLQGTVTILKHV